VAGLRVGQSFAAIPVPEPPVIRKGASGSFHDKGLEGASHHAVIPNVNTIGNLREVWPRLSSDEKKLFDVIARAYLAAVMPDFRYRQTTATLDVNGFAFRAAGRQPIDLGWRAAFPDWRPAEEKGDEAQLLPQLSNGEMARLQNPTIEDKETRPPARYNEGTLIEAMQNAWRFVDDEVLRERLKEAKGIGTPATRAEIIGGLKKQGFLIAQVKNIVPTETGLSLFGVLSQADPALVHPGVTAQLECLLDDVVVGKQEKPDANPAAPANVATAMEIAREKGAGISEEAAAISVPIHSTPGTNRRKRQRKTIGEPPKSTAPKSTAAEKRPRKRTAHKATAAAAPPDPARQKSGAVTPLRIPYGNKEAALRLGARYGSGGWYAPHGADLGAFRERGWL
jgi:DNA topoisomerase-3